MDRRKVKSKKGSLLQFPNLRGSDRSDSISVSSNISISRDSSMDRSLTSEVRTDDESSKQSIGQKRRKLVRTPSPLLQEKNSEDEKRGKKRSSSPPKSPIRKTRGSFDDEEMDDSMLKTSKNKKRKLTEEKEIEEKSPNGSKKSPNVSTKSPNASKKSPQQKKPEDPKPSTSRMEITHSNSDDDLFDDSPQKNDPPPKNMTPVRNDFKSPKIQEREKIAEKSKGQLRGPLSQRKKLEQSSKGSRSNYSKTSVVAGTAPEKLEKFLNDAGIILSIDEQPHTLKNHPPKTVEILDKLITGKNHDSEEVIECWKTYIELENNLKKALNNVEMENQESNLISTSLVRLLLQCPTLQQQMLESLEEKLLEHVVTDERNLPWVCSLVDQLRFLEIIANPDGFTTFLTNLLECGAPCFQSHLIFYIPDMIVDSQHYEISQTLRQLMEKNEDLTGVILECISHLSIGQENMEELRAQILSKLGSYNNIAIIPSIIKFVFTDCDNIETYKKVLEAICKLELTPFSVEKDTECFKAQAATLNALKMKILALKDVKNAAAQVTKCSIEDKAFPFHFIIILLVSNMQSVKNKKLVEANLKHHIRTGYYRESFLVEFYAKYKTIADILQPNCLDVASTILKIDEIIYVDFASTWFRQMFMIQKDSIMKQREVMQSLTSLMGFNQKTARNALNILATMVQQKDELKCLEGHSRHLKLILDKIEDLPLEDVGTLCDVMYGLCENSSIARDALGDDLAILMQKQLSHINTHLKCKGVLSAVMSMKHLAEQEDKHDAAIKLFDKIVRNVDHCSKARALFYDRLGIVIAKINYSKSGPHFNKIVLEYIKEYFTEKFLQNHCIDQSEYKGELVPKFEISADDNGFCINFGNGVDGAIVPILFRVLRMCSEKLCPEQKLIDIRAALEAPILTPPNLDSFENEDLNFMFNCVNWFRELINAFITQKSNTTRKIVIKRLKDLMELQGELLMGLSLSTSYQPPPCYFHYNPTPAFVRSEKKFRKKKGKKGTENKSLNISENEAWNSSSEICSKNPAYFRRFDTKVSELLDLNMDILPSQMAPENITMAQVCFLVNELLLMSENDRSDIFIRDLVNQLPNICSKFRAIVEDLEKNDDNTEKIAVKLLLQLITAIFSWKEFQTAKYSSLLQRGLRELASLSNENNKQLKSTRELVKESYKYFSSRIDVADQISIAVALVKLCETLMKLVGSFNEKNAGNHANFVMLFLNQPWEDDQHSVASYKSAVDSLLKSWYNYEPTLLAKVTAILKDLPEEVQTLDGSSDHLPTVQAITKFSFPLFYKKLLESLTKGVIAALNAAKTDPAKVKIWKQTMMNLEQIVKICKDFNINQNLLLFVRLVPAFLKVFLAKGMPVLEYNLKYQTDDVTYILRHVQGATKHLNKICCTALQKKDVVLTKHIPAAKQVAEQLLFSVKGMMVLNKTDGAFWMGTLKNKNLEGQDVLSQRSSEDSSATEYPEATTNDGSEVECSDLDNDEEETTEP